MHLSIKHQETYSRGELLLRTFFGVFYIMIPHVIVLSIMEIASSFITSIAFWAILFTGNYPRSMFEFQVKMHNWRIRLAASLSNMIDGYPPIGTGREHPSVQLSIPYPESLSRGKLLLKSIFGIFYVGIPHGFCIYFRMIATQFINSIAWWLILFTGSYPKDWHEFNVGTHRWLLRIQLYLLFMSDEYPPFSGKENP